MKKQGEAQDKGCPRLHGKLLLSVFSMMDVLRSQ